MNQNNQLPLFDDFEYKPESETQIDSLSEENKITLLALNEVQGVGFATIRALFDAFNGDLLQVWGLDNEQLFLCLQKASIPQSRQIVHQIKARADEVYSIAQERYLFLKRRKVEILLRGTPSYPQSLYDLKSPPAWLFVEGNVELLHNPAIVAVVGTREPTEIGLNAARRLSVLLVTQGCVILSGLAEGIDEAGHQTAVDFGSPTIAVLGHGIDVVFPAATSNLRQQIIEQGGAVVSEYLPKDMYSGERFVQRNRIQSALAKIVAIVEGRAKSGTAHTVRFARELHRPLFGVRIGSASNTQQQELLKELIKQKYPVFALDDQIDRNQLSKYLTSNIPLEKHKQAEPPHLFRGLLGEIHRLTHEYDPKQSDFEWLMSQISSYRDNAERMNKDDN